MSLAVSELLIVKLSSLPVLISETVSCKEGQIYTEQTP